MATEYKLSYTAEEIDEKLGEVDNAIKHSQQTLTEAQKAQARENIGAVDEDYVEQTIATAMGAADLNDYELVGDTPLYLAGANTKYNIILDVKEETDVSIISDTVAEMSDAINVANIGCTETTENGIHTLTCTGSGQWFGPKKTFTITNLVAGEKYDVLLDYIGSDRGASGYAGHFQIVGTDGKQLFGELFGHGSGIKMFSFTAQGTQITVNLFPVCSNFTVEPGMFIQYRDIWINKADAKVVRSEVYNFSATTSERLHLNNVGGGITITTSPITTVYKQTISGEEADTQLAEKTCVCFGDSITGNYASPLDYPSIISRVTGMKVINGGFGGCCMSKHPAPAYAAFSMYSLANSVASGDWSVQDTNLSSISSANAAEHLETLKALDWSAVDYITIFYGTNDLTNGASIGADDGSLTTNQFKGALRHSIETILTAHPKIRIILLTPIYRFWKEGETVTDSDSYEVSGRKLTDYVEAVLDVASEYKLPVFNLYNSLGINKINRTTFLADGTHPSQDGIERIGETIASRLLAI